MDLYTMDKDILNVLNNIQASASNHQKYLKIMENTYKKVDFNKFATSFLKYLRVTLYADMEKNIYVDRTLDFFAKFVTWIVNPTENESDDWEESPSHPLLRSVIEETLKFHDVANVQARYHVCKFISLILQHISYNTSLEGDLCDDIQEAMLIRVQDPKTSIRLQAVKALVRLQEPKNPECPVVKAYLSLMRDPSAAVRKEVVKSIARNLNTISRIKYFIRDVDNSVKVAAISRCADIGAKQFSIEERQHILSCGFKETNKQARQVFMDNLLTKWLGGYNGDILAFLYALKLDAKEEDLINSEEICKNVMEILFETVPLEEILSFLPVGPDKLIPSDKVTSHIVVYWSILVHHLNTNENEEDLEKIRPELTQFCHFIESFIKKKNERVMDNWDYTEYQYILYNLFEMVELYDLTDEVGRRALHKLVMLVLQNYRLEFRTLCKVMTIAEKFVTKVDSFVNEICEIISEIHEPLMEKEPTQKDSDERECQVARVKFQLTSLQCELEAALAQHEYQKCALIQTKLTECKQKLEEMSQPSQTTERVRVAKEDPDTICRCLDILASVLMLKKVRSMCPALQTCKDEFLTPLLSSDYVDVNWRVLKCLTYYCILDKRIAEDHAKILCIPIATYRTVVNYNKMALMVSVSAVTDLIRIYGSSIVGCEDEVNATSINSTRRKLFRAEEDVAEADQNCSKMTFDAIIEIMLDMLDDENEEVRDIAITAIGKLMFHDFPVSSTLIARLILKWYNPHVGTDYPIQRPVLLEKWRKAQKERSATKLQLMLGHLIDHYTKTAKDAKPIIGKAVIPVIQKITSAPRTSPLAEIDLDNVAKFLAVVTSSPNDAAGVHISMAHDMIEKIKSKPRDDIVPALTKVLINLDIQPDDTNVITQLIEKVESLLEEDDALDKAPKRNVLKFIGKLRAFVTEYNSRNQLDTITENTENSEVNGNLEEIREIDTVDRMENITSDSVNNHQKESDHRQTTKRLRINGEKILEDGKGEELIIEQSDDETEPITTSNRQENAVARKSTELSEETDEDPIKDNNNAEATGTQTQNNQIQEIEKTVIDETPPETSSESSSSTIKKLKHNALNKQLEVRLERKIQTRSSSNNKSNSTDSSPPDKSSTESPSTSSTEGQKRNTLNNQPKVTSTRQLRNNKIPEKSSSESSSSSSEQQKLNAKHNQSKISLKRTIQIRRNDETDSGDSIPTRTTRRNKNKIDTVQRTHALKTRKNNTLNGSKEAISKRPRIELENGGINPDGSSTESERLPIRSTRTIQKPRRFRSQPNYAESTGSGTTSSTSVSNYLKDRKVASDSETTSTTSSSNGKSSKRDSVENFRRQVIRRSQRRNGDIRVNGQKELRQRKNGMLVKEGDKENKNRNGKKTTQCSESLSASSDFSESRIVRPVAESTRNNITVNSSSNNMLNASKVLEGGKNAKKNSLFRISEERISVSLNEVQTKRKKARGSAATRWSQRLSQNSDLNSSNDTVLHTIVMEASHRMDRLETESDNSVFSTPQSTPSGRQSKTIVSPTSSDSDSVPSSSRKSTRKIKKKRFDGYVK